MDNVYGRLTIRNVYTENNVRYAYAECACGTYKRVRYYDVRSGRVQSCGCLRRETASQCKYKHGQAAHLTRTYTKWRNMRARCHHDPDYTHVSVVARWDDFSLFLQDMGECPEGYSIERIDPHGDYSPTNCTWIPLTEQGANKRNTIYLTVGHETKPLAQWCREYGVKYDTVHNRVKKGWTALKALGVKL